MLCAQIYRGKYAWHVSKWKERRDSGSFLLEGKKSAREEERKDKRESRDRYGFN